MEIMPDDTKDDQNTDIEMSPWKETFSKQFKYTTGRPVPVVEGYLPGAAKNRLSINEGDDSPSARRQREASIREGSRRRESAAKGESRRFSFMSSAAEFNKLLIESQQNEKKKDEKKRKPRADKRNRLSSGTFSNLSGKDSRQALLSTYVTTNGSHCGKTALYITLVMGCALFLLGFIVGVGVLPVLVDDMVKSELIISPDGPCFSRKDGGMCPGSVQARYFLWNITNPNEYLQGSQPPELEEVGPFTYTSYEKVYNASFSRNKTMVDYDYTYFWEFSAQDSCEACQDPASSPLYTVNSAYLQVLNQAGGSETSLIMAFLPQVFSNLYEGLKATVATFATEDATEAELDALVFGQWANCSVLNDTVSSLTAYQAMDPYVPEVGAWRSANVDASFSSGLSAEVAKKLFGKQSEVDPLDPFPDPLSFIGAAMMMPDADFSALSGVPSDQIATLKGYFGYVIGTYGTMTLTAIVGPPLGDTSTGLIIKRSAKDLLEGWQDPLMAGFMPGMNMSYNLGFHMDLLDSLDEQMASGVIDSTHPFVFNKEALTGHYDPTEIGEVLSFDGMRNIQHGNGSRAVFGRSQDPSTGLRFYDFRNQQDFTLFHEGLQRSLVFLRDADTTVVRKIDTLHFTLDPSAAMTCEENEMQCTYADSMDGAWNISSVYLAESAGSFPQWYYQGGAEEDTAQLTFNPENRREWGMDIEPRLGVLLKYAMPFQYNYFVAPTDVLHQTIWTPNGTNAPGGAWIPNFYYDLMVEISAKDAIKLRQVLFLLKVVTLGLLCGFPMFGIIMVVFSTYKLFFSLETIKREKQLKEKLRTRASTVQVNRESMKMKQGGKRDVESQGHKDPLNRHHYSFTNTPKSSLH